MAADESTLKSTEVVVAEASDGVSGTYERADPVAMTDLTGLRVTRGISVYRVATV